MLKKYFNTPKMPLTFYITDLTIYNLIILLFIYFSSSMNDPENKVLTIVFTIIGLGFVALQAYTWAWFCDYMIFKYGDNALVQFMFRPFGISKRGAATAAMISFATDVQYDVSWDKWGYGRVNRNYGSNFQTLGCMAVILLFPRLMLSTAIAPWTILFHMVIINQYKKDVQQELEKNQN